jgi:hypothetical protein
MFYPFIVASDNSGGDILVIYTRNNKAGTIIEAVFLAEVPDQYNRGSDSQY